MKFSDDNKEVREFDSNYFTFGVHKVQIAGVELAETDDGKEYVEITVVDPADGEKTDTARVWFTTDQAANFSFNTLRQIFVHNTPEDRKDAGRQLFDKVADTTELVGVLGALVGKDCWFTKYHDATRTYVGKDGVNRKSVNKNIYGYEPKLKPELMPTSGPTNVDGMLNQAKAAFGGDTTEVPFESKSDAAGSTVPTKDAWAK